MYGQRQRYSLRPRAKLVQKGRSFISSGPVRKFKIKNETDCIFYYFHSNYVTALETRIWLFPESIIWDYESNRFGEFILGMR